MNLLWNTEGRIEEILLSRSSITHALEPSSAALLFHLVRGYSESIELRSVKQAVSGIGISAYYREHSYPAAIVGTKMSLS